MKLDTLFESKNLNHVGIFIPLPAKLAREYPHKKEDQSQPHITVLYIGEASSDDIPKIKKVARAVCKRHKPIEIFTSGCAYFKNHDGDQVAHSMVEGKGLATLSKDLWDSMLREGIKVAHSYPEYTAHVTLEYCGKKRDYDGPTPSGDWIAKSVELWQGKGEKVTKLTLSGK